MRDHLASTGRARPPVLSDSPSSPAVVNIASFAIIVAGFYFARDVLIPIALAVLLSFILSPLVNLLRRRGLGRVPSVMMAIVIALRRSDCEPNRRAARGFAEQAGRYEVTVQHSIETARDATFGKLSAILSHIGQHLVPLAGRQEAPSPSGEGTKPTPSLILKPVPVEVRQPEHSALELAQSILTPVVSPLATLFITFVFAIFILLQREDLRDRLIRLFGSTDLHRMTLAMDDAADRLSCISSLCSGSMRPSGQASQSDSR